jgi:hypothetical protein
MAEGIQGQAPSANAGSPIAHGHRPAVPIMPVRQERPDAAELERSPLSCIWNGKRPSPMDTLLAWRVAQNLDDWPSVGVSANPVSTRVGHSPAEIKG